MRSAWGVNILDLSPEQLATMKKTLTSYGLKVSSIGSPIGKIFIDEDFAPHLRRMRHAAEVAHHLDAPALGKATSATSTAAANPGQLSDAHRLRYLNFLGALAGAGKIRVDLETNRRSIAVITAAYESARTARPVVLS